MSDIRDHAGSSENADAQVGETAAGTGEQPEHANSAATDSVPGRTGSEPTGTDSSIDVAADAAGEAANSTANAPATSTDGGPTGGNTDTVKISRPDVSTEAGTTAHPELPNSLTFRVNRASLLVALAIAACATPLATMAGGPAPLLYLIPIGLAAWIWRTSTTVDRERITVRTVFNNRHLPWERVNSVRLDEHRWAQAVLNSGERVRLPAVRVRDVPRLSVMSGGWLPNPEGQE